MIKKLLIILSLFFYVTKSVAATCIKLSETCVDGPSTKVISGVSVYRSCWQYQDTYDCSSAAQQSDCQALIDKGCGQISSKCINTLSDGSCDTYEQQYSCVKIPATTNTVTDCGTQTFCQNGQCFNSGSTPDTDFAAAVTGLEIQRQFGKYMDGDGTIFKGIPDTCRKKLGNLVNCCSVAAGSGANTTNKTAMALNTASTVYEAIGSSYTYDSLFQGTVVPDWIETGYSYLFGAGGNGYTSSLLAEYLTTDMTTAEFVSEMMPGPWTIAILIIMYSGILNCDDTEKVLGMKRDQHLCTMIGSYCSTKIPGIGTCVETTESYCCYNSKLSRIINEQGRPQLGKVYGPPEHPDCSGFTPDQLQKLDFSKIDLSEFIKDIMPQLPSQSDQSQLVNSRVNSYYP